MIINEHQSKNNCQCLTHLSTSVSGFCLSFLSHILRVKLTLIKYAKTFLSSTSCTFTQLHIKRCFIIVSNQSDQSTSFYHIQIQVLGLTFSCLTDKVRPFQVTSLRVAACLSLADASRFCHENE